MKLRFLPARLLLALALLTAVCQLPTRSAETNATANASAEAAFPEFNEMRDQLNAMQRSSSEATEKWESLMKQNSSLSNRLAGLHQSLLTQQERELEMSKQSNSFLLKVMGGAGAAVFLIIILSFWFQLRCFNRVLETSNGASLTAATPLLESENSPTIKLLSAVKLLESRIQQLEFPANSHPNGNGTAHEIHLSHTETPVPILVSESQRESTGPQSNVAVLLAKGQVLLDMDRLPEAIGCFDEALALEPGNAEAHLKRGMSLERMERLEPALNAYEEALRLNPRRAVAYVYKARVLQGLHRYDEALSVYDSALGKNSNRPTTATLSA